MTMARVRTKARIVTTKAKTKIAIKLNKSEPPAKPGVRCIYAFVSSSVSAETSAGLFSSLNGSIGAGSSDIA